MKTNTNKPFLVVLMLALGFNASAATRLCYVQSQDAEGVYKDALAQKQIATDDYQNHVLLQEGDFLYTVMQSKEDEKLQLAIFSRKDQSTLVLVSANGSEGITLIHQPTKRLLGCSPTIK